MSVLFVVDARGWSCRKRKAEPMEDNAIEVAYRKWRDTAPPQLQAFLDLAKSYGEASARFQYTTDTFRKISEALREREYEETTR